MMAPALASRSYVIGASSAVIMHANALPEQIGFRPKFPILWSTGQKDPLYGPDVTRVGICPGAAVSVVEFATAALQSPPHVPSLQLASNLFGHSIAARSFRTGQPDELQIKEAGLDRLLQGVGEQSRPKRVLPAPPCPAMLCCVPVSAVNAPADEQQVDCVCTTGCLRSTTAKTSGFLCFAESTGDQLHCEMGCDAGVPRHPSAAARLIQEVKPPPN